MNQLAGTRIPGRREAPSATTTSVPHTRLQQVLSPMPVDQFLHDYWADRFLYVPGPPNKFEALFSWDVLNRTLQHHRFAPEPLRLFKDGKGLDWRRFLLAAPGCVNGAALMREFEDGASVILDHCDEVHLPL